MTPLAILQLHILPRSSRLPALMLASSLVFVPAVQNQQSSTLAQSPSDSGIGARKLSGAERQRPLGIPSGKAIPRSRQTLGHAPSPQTAGSAQPQLFLDTGPPQYATGDDSWATAGGDFNGDGKPDLVAVYSNFVSVLLGNGDGSFQAHVDYPTATSPRSVGVGDFNRDGHLDIVTSSGNYVSVLLGNGDGTFQTHVDYAVCSGGFAAADVNAVADVNGDGNPDLAFPSCDNNSVTILLGKGDGTFQAPVNSPVGSGAASIAVGDFNNDGKADLAVAREILTLPTTFVMDILLGNGDGTFQAPTEYSHIFGPLAAADFNGDGNLDLVCGNGVELLGNGDGTFGNPVKNGVYWSNGSVVGDFNQDGKVDIASPSFNYVSVWLGNGDGTFKDAEDYSTGFYPFSVVVGDFNGDGKADLTVLNDYGSSVSMLLGNGDGTFPNPPLYPLDADADQMVSGDFNGDGIADLAVENPNEQTVSILPAKSDGTFQPKVDSATGGFPAFLAVGDFNRDGHADVAISSDFFVNVLLGKGNGSFQPPVSYAVLPSSGSFPGAVAVGDFDGDGIPDLAVANGNPYSGDGWVSILLGNGDGTFRTHVEYPTGGFPAIVAVGDLNGDGRADLVLTTNVPGGSVNVLLGNGNGTFQAPVAYASGLYDPVGLAIGDFNGDGKPDLVVDHLDSAVVGSSVSVLIGNGDGSFQTPVEYETGGTPSLIGIGDFNGDGNFDLAVNTRGLSGFISIDILLGNGNGTFQAYEEYAKGEIGSSATIADFNGDGAPDIGFLLPFGPASVILNLRGTALDLQSSQSSVLLGQSVTFTATIHAGLSGVSLPVPTGTLKFMDGTNQLNAQTLGADGVVTFATSALTSGTHNISAAYSGDATFNPHTVALVQVVNGPDFAVSTTPDSATLNAGSSATFSVAVSPMYGFNGSVSLTCSVSPASALAPTCSLNSTSVSGSGTSNLTVSTTGSTAVVLPTGLKLDWHPFCALSLPVLGLALLGTGISARGSRRKKKVLTGILVINLLTVAVGLQVACGGSSSSTSTSGTPSASGTPSGQYTVTVSAVSGPVSHATKVTLTVQ